MSGTGSMLCACTTVSCTIPPSRIFSPEVTLVGSHGSDRVCIRSRYILHYYYTTIVVVPLRMTDKAIGSDMTPKGSLGCAHTEPKVGNFSLLESVFPVLFHYTCLTSNTTYFFTKSVASTGFSNILVTSVMLCAPHRWMSL